jgi:hypothetical protein
MAKINIITKGRFGTIEYIEGSMFRKKTYEFQWEFGGGDTVAIIWFPKDEAAWNEKYPSAKGRRMEIVRDMAEQVRKKQAPSSTLKWEDGTVLLVSG